MSDVRNIPAEADARRGPTVAVLYPGELGAALAGLLRRRGLRVVTTLAGRGAVTARRCQEEGVEILGSLEEVVRIAEVVLSVVPPAAAVEVAEAYCALAAMAPQGAVYVDVNSVSPEVAREMAERVKGCGRGFVDAAVNGLAKNVPAGGTLYLSGLRAGAIAGVFEGLLRVVVLGEEAGRASGMKMLLSGVSKGICGLFVELGVVAERQGMLTEFSEATARIYPGVWALVERMLPTYAAHAGRRATETAELQRTVRAAGLEPVVIAGVREIHEILAAVWPDVAPRGGGGWTLASVVKELAANGFLAAETVHPGTLTGDQHGE
jgi:3-hydroxyisobutyrate dehydrogenase-like beta-hydroxyacid dehydrogenase